MKRDKIDCVYCAYEDVKPGLGSYCNFFREKTKSLHDYDIAGHKAFRVNPNCNGFTLIEAMRNRFKQVNSGEDWLGPSSPIELEN